MTSHVIPSYLSKDDLGPWGVFLQQIDRVTPYLGELAFWVESLKRPKRILIVDVPIKMDDGTVASLRRLPRAAQHLARARQGRGALPPGRDAVRGDGAGRLDDGQERRDRRALRRRQGRRAGRPARAVDGGARARHAALHQRDRHHHRPGQGHPGARRQHQRAGHGVDDGHLLGERRAARPPAWSPASRSRSAAASGATRPRAAACSSSARGGGEAASALPIRRRARLRAGLRQRRRRSPAELLRRCRRQGDDDPGRVGHDPQPARPRRAQADRAWSTRGRQHRRVPRCRGDRRTTQFWDVESRHS